MTTWFTSDTHFWHKAIVKYCNRPVPPIRDCTNAVAEMNEWLIERWNKVVKPEDEVWHLGDFFFCGKDKAVAILERLNGQLKWVLGNHDYKLAKALKNHALVASGQLDIKGSYKFLRVNISYEDDDGETKQYPQPIVLCHFPILSWDQMAHGAWHLHGHCHGSIDSSFNHSGLRMDVGVDAKGNDWSPVSLEEIQNRMALRTVTPVDHHM